MSKVFESLPPPRSWEKFYERVSKKVIKSLGGERYTELNDDGCIVLFERINDKTSRVVGTYSDWVDFFINCTLPRVDVDYIHYGEEFVRSVVGKDYYSLSKFLDFDELNKERNDENNG